jgi:hypothetical protein
VSRWLLKEGKYDLLEHHQEVSRLLIEGLRPAPQIR